jgi:hypothetical protein
MTVFRDLSQHILDIVENGVTAGADLLHIDIQEDLSNDYLSIKIVDNGRGMDADILKRVADPWVTTRTSRRVGLGIPFLKQTAEMCGGHFEIQSEVGRGTVTQATFQHSHIDRPPLGDVASTVLCLIVGHPDVDVVYHHEVIADVTTSAIADTAGGTHRVFELDTREIREVLGEDVPFSDPEVLAFLRSTLEDGVASLRHRDA